MSDASKKNTFKMLTLELLVLFVGVPLILVLPIHAVAKAGIVLTAVAYTIVVSIKNRIASKRQLYFIPAKSKYWRIILIRTLILVCVTIVFMFHYHPDKLFIVAKKNIGLLVVISIFYSVFSVYPQEFLYRSFFYKRYHELFNQKWILLITNALLFSFAHIVFLNPLVLAITFIGGVVFSLTYQKTGSVMQTSVEHAIYGCWIFAVGMGEMLAFPMPT